MENSKIEWTDHTFNPWIGCTKVSEACKNCYAEVSTFNRRAKAVGNSLWGINADRHRTSPAYWKNPLKWNKKATSEGKRDRVFCASLADVFEDRPDLEAWRAELFQLIDATPHLDWLLLTKRPHNIRAMWPGGYRANVWRMTTVENQKAADERIPHLIATNDLSPIAGLSCEPMMEGIDLTKIEIQRDAFGSIQLNVLAGTRTSHDYYGDHIATTSNSPVIHWVICGGESGHHARPMNPEWARQLRDQCQNANVAFLFKQWGEWKPVNDFSIGNPKHHPEQGAFLGDTFYPGHMVGGQGIQMRKLGKKTAGRLLDEKEWTQFPEGGKYE